MWHCCQRLQPEIVSIYRQLHQIPEIGTHLPKTSAFVRKKLEEIGIPYVLSREDDGILATIDTGRAGKTLLLRADMDALAIREETDLPFASCHPGKMHACGHDAHMAMLLTAGKVLWENRQDLTGKIKLLFQTAEEFVGGAKLLIDQGWLEGSDAIFGIHIGSLMGAHIPSGTVIAAPGCCMASVDHFQIDIQGKGCHGSSPEKGIDPINIAAHLILALQTIPAREVAAASSVTLSVGSIHGGSQGNIIPDSVQMLGTLRCVDPQVRQRVLRRMEQMTEHTASSFGGTARIRITSAAPALINDSQLAQLAAECLAQVVGKENLITRLAAPNMASEDFAYYLEKIPGVFLFLSSSDPARGTDVPHHNAKFTIDERVLHLGAAAFVAIAQRFLT